MLISSKAHFVCLIFLFSATLVFCHHSGEHHGGKKDNDKGSKQSDSGCEGTCFKISSLKAHSAGERFLQGKCTVQNFYPVYGEICTCFFNLGYHCYIQYYSGTTAGGGSTTTTAAGGYSVIAAGGVSTTAAGGASTTTAGGSSTAWGGFTTTAAAAPTATAGTGGPGSG